MLEKKWVSKTGLPCFVIINEHLGHRCGYVGVSPNNNFYKIDCNEPVEFLDGTEDYSMGVNIISVPQLGSLSREVEVHGGLTFSGDQLPDIENEENLWFFGYDCGHAWDAPDFITLRKLLPPDSEAIKNITKYQELTSQFLHNQSGVIRTLDYCENQCEKLAEQLNKYRKPNTEIFIRNL